MAFLFLSTAFPCLFLEAGKTILNRNFRISYHTFITSLSHLLVWILSKFWWHLIPHTCRKIESFPTHLSPEMRDKNRPKSNRDWFWNVSKIKRRFGGEGASGALHTNAGILFSNRLSRHQTWKGHGHKTVVRYFLELSPLKERNSKDFRSFYPFQLSENSSKMLCNFKLE